MNAVTAQEGQPAPDFTLAAIGSDDVVKDGQVQLSALHDHVVVLYFYPKDDTPGCTIEACSFRDANHLMQKRGIVVLGISVDDIASHQKFIDKFSLPFPLLADTDKTVVQQYGVWKEKTNYGRTYLGVDRQTFLIDKEGVIRKIWHKVKPDGHAQDVLDTVEALHL